MANEQDYVLEYEPIDLIRDKFSQECSIETVRRLLTVHFDLTEEQAQKEIDDYFRIVDWMDEQRRNGESCF
ncbi:MAG: hypothetical protein J1E39_05730 [Eubacterium sp.]|nr:hypothetical protein [Eubacterium sp.]